MWPTLRTLAIGALGAVVAMLAGIPAPFLTGPAFFVSLSALAGVRGTMPLPLRDLCFVLVGTNMGAAVTPETMATAARWPGSLAVMAGAVLIIMLGGGWLLQRLFRYSRMTGLLAATPGHLSFVLSLSSDVESDVRQISIIQTLRVLALTLIVPLLAPLLSKGELPSFVMPGHIMAPVPLVVILLAGGAVGLVMKRLNVPAALLLGPMLVSSVAHVATWVDGSMPVWLSVPAFVTIGTMIGTRFSGITFGMLRQALGAAAVLTGFAALVSLIAAVLAAWLFGLPIITVLIAFAPGGLETMMAMSVLLDANPAYIAAHHVFRLLLLTVLVPVMVARAR